MRALFALSQIRIDANQALRFLAWASINFQMTPSMISSAPAPMRIGRGARVAGQAGVISDLAGNADYMGMPAQPAKAFLRQVALLKRLAARKAGGQDEAGAGGLPNAAAEPTAETGRN